MFSNYNIKRINIITCTDIFGGIGKNNKLPWKCKEDMLFFKNMTSNNIVIMGRNTFESIGKKPLKNRINIVLSNTLKQTKEYDNLFICENLKNVLNICKKENNKEIFIIGGQKIYSFFIEKFQNNKNIDIKLYITTLYENYNCDTFFEFNPFGYRILYKSSTNKFYCNKNQSYIDYDIKCYIKK